MEDIVAENEKNLKNETKVKYIPVSAEAIGEKFEQDARRYKRYLGDDSRAVLI